MSKTLVNWDQGIKFWTFKLYKKKNNHQGSNTKDLYIDLLYDTSASTEEGWVLSSQWTHSTDTVHMYECLF